MPHQVLIYSRFPKAQMVRIGERSGDETPLAAYGIANLDVFFREGRTVIR